MEPSAEPVLVGLEQEFLVWKDGERADFRELIRGLAYPGGNLDPGDENAHRLPSGIVVTCDDSEAEFASPPIRVRPRFAVRIDRLASAGLAELRRPLPERVALSGYSTHISVSMPDDLLGPATFLVASTFGVGLTMLLDGRESYGIYVRPRPGRVEICGEYLVGEQLRAAVLYAAGAVLACRRALERRDGAQLPPSLLPAVRSPATRQGIYLAREAFGEDLHGRGRNALLRLPSGHQMSGQEHLERSCRTVRNELEGLGLPTEDLAPLDSARDGRSPLRVEAAQAQATCSACQSRTVHGLPSRARVFGGATITPVLATWEHCVFEVRAGASQRLLNVPRSNLPVMARLMRSADASKILETLAESPAEEVLRSREQVQRPGIFADMERGELLPHEPGQGGSVSRNLKKRKRRRFAPETPAEPAYPSPTLPMRESARNAPGPPVSQEQPSRRRLGRVPASVAAGAAVLLALAVTVGLWTRDDRAGAAVPKVPPSPTSFGTTLAATQTATPVTSAAPTAVGVGGGDSRPAASSATPTGSPGGSGNGSEIGAVAGGARTEVAVPAATATPTPVTPTSVPTSPSVAAPSPAPSPTTSPTSTPTPSPTATPAATGFVVPPLGPSPEKTVAPPTTVPSVIPPTPVPTSPPTPVPTPPPTPCDPATGKC